MSTIDPRVPAGLKGRDVDRWFHALAELDCLRYRAALPPARPVAAPAVVAHHQTGDRLVKTFEYDLGNFSDPADPDVTARRVKVKVDGTPQPDVDLPLDRPTHTLKGVRVGQAVEATYAFVDDAGNASGDSPPLAFTCADDVAPAAPAAGEFAVVAHRQVDDGAGPGPPPPPIP